LVALKWEARELPRMSDHSDDHASDRAGDHPVDHDELHGHDVEGLERITSPMQTFSTSQVGIGFAVLAVGLLVAFVLPFVAA
jgi:hypothetical protein